MKKCSKCHKSYLATTKYFYKDNGKSTGLRSTCKECDNCVKEKYKYRCKPLDPTTKRKRLNDYYLRKYGIMVENYDKLFMRQRGLCAICGMPEVTRYKGKLSSLSVDHSHKTGKVRGLLCRKCNSMLGSVDDNPETLIRAILYLER